MAELIIGAVAAGGFLLLARFSRERGLTVRWWGWALTLLGFLYGVFVLEIVVEFLREGTPKGAVVMGTIMGFGGIVWAVLLGRFVFRGAGKLPASGPLETEEGSHV